MLFDQRGCGRSRPHASAPTVDLATNTTHHLIADIERLRCHLAIERWLVLGGSWGSTLALAYGQAHPDRVSEMVLFSVATTTRREVDWITRDVGRLFPAEWERFRNGVPEPDRDGRLVDAYSRLLHDPDPAVRAQAARDWCDWEDAHVRGVDRLAGVPSMLVHGRLDVSSRLDIPWNLASAWDACELVVVGDEGHGGGPGMAVAVLAATDRLAVR